MDPYQPTLDEETKSQYTEALRQALLDIALKFGEGVGRDGKPYQWMVDCRELLLTGPYLHYASRLLWERIKTYRPNAIGGLTLAANPLTIGLMYEGRAEGVELEGLLIRREPKNNGLQKQVEGSAPQSDWKVVLLDDLVNAGGTQKQAMAALRPFGCEVVAVGVIVDYEKAGSEWLLDRGYELEALFTLEGLGVLGSEPSQPKLLRQEWSVPLNKGEYSAPKSSPVASGDRLFVGSDCGHFKAFTVDGQELWNHEVRDKQRGIHSTPLICDGQVVFGSYDGYLTCLSEETGELLWETRPGQWIGSSAVANSDGSSYFIGIEYGESGGSLISVNSKDGKTLWELSAQAYIHSTPLYDNSRKQVIVGCNDGMLRCADALTGELKWSFQSQGEIKAQAAVDEQGRCFFCSFDGLLYALSAVDGRLLWKKRLSARLYTTPLLYKDLVMAGGTSQRLLALERDTGRVRWLKAQGGALMGGACLAEELNAVVTGGHQGELTAFSLETGSTLWTHDLEHKFMGTPLWHQGKLYAASFGDLVCLGIHDSV